MPNWCSNRVDVYSENKTDLQKVLDIFSNKESVFGQVIPEPNWKTIPNKKGELPKLEQMKNPDGSIAWETYNFPDGKNDDRWYDWRNSNWDTKWDVAGNVEVEEERWGADGNDELEAFTANFTTAWAPPEAICMRLRQLFPNVTISWFYDEPGCQVAGYL